VPDRPGFLPGTRYFPSLEAIRMEQEADRSSAGAPGDEAAYEALRERVEALEHSLRFLEETADMWLSWDAHDATPPLPEWIPATARAQLVRDYARSALIQNTAEWCPECQSGRHLCCLDDGSSVWTGRCKCRCRTAA